MIEYLFLITAILASTISILLFKKISEELDFKNGYIKGIKSFINIYSILTLMFVFISIFFYTLALTKITLGFAYSFVNSLTILLVVSGGYLFYKEEIKKKQFFGIILVISGLFCYIF